MGHREKSSVTCTIKFKKGVSTNIYDGRLKDFFSLCMHEYVHEIIYYVGDSCSCFMMVISLRMIFIGDAMRFHGFMQVFL